MFTVVLLGEGCVEMDIPWQLCRTIGPLLSKRFPLASAKAQPRGGFPFNMKFSVPGGVPDKKLVNLGRS